MQSAIFGLIGVVLGSILTVTKEWWFRRREIKKEREYLTVLIAFSLEKFASECADVVNDDGLFQGQYDDDGCRSAQVTTPDFNPHAFDVEWKAIPAELMYDIFNLVNEIEMSNHRINDAFEYSSGPPDYEDGFEERQISYATLGIQALTLADCLRSLGNLPKREALGWNPLEAMSARRDKVEESRTQRMKRQEEFLRKTSKTANAETA